MLLFLFRWAGYPGDAEPGPPGHIHGRTLRPGCHLAGLGHRRHHQRVQQEVPFVHVWPSGFILTIFCPRYFHFFCLFICLEAFYLCWCSNMTTFGRLKPSQKWPRTSWTVCKIDQGLKVSWEKCRYESKRKMYCMCFLLLLFFGLFFFFWPSSMTRRSKPDIKMEPSSGRPVDYQVRITFGLDNIVLK